MIARMNAFFMLLALAGSTVVTQAAPVKAPVATSPKAPIAPVKAPTAPIKFPAAPVVPPKAPTKGPTKVPTKSPTKVPTKAPTKMPIKAPTKAPIKAPTKMPIKAPTKAPIKAPTKAPIKAPTKAPVKAPVVAPKAPVKAPVQAPVKAPVPTPVQSPVKVPVATTSIPTLAPLATVSNVTRINAGGDSFTDALGQIWMADTNFNDGAGYGSCPKSINGTVEDDLYCTFRWFAPWHKSPHSYNIQVPAPAKYAVRLHFAEIVSPFPVYQMTDCSFY
jgi:Malectin domain